MAENSNSLNSYSDNLSNTNDDLFIRNLRKRFHSEWTAENENGILPQKTYTHLYSVVYKKPGSHAQYNPNLRIAQEVVVASMSPRGETTGTRSPTDGAAGEMSSNQTAEEVAIAPCANRQFAIRDFRRQEEKIALAQNVPQVDQSEIESSPERRGSDVASTSEEVSDSVVECETSVIESENDQHQSGNSLGDAEGKDQECGSSAGGTCQSESVSRDTRSVYEDVASIPCVSAYGPRFSTVCEIPMKNQHVTVNIGAHQVLSCVDTGSFYSFISKECCILTNNVCHPLLPTDACSVVLADASKMEISLKAYLHIHFDTHSAYFKFFVASRLNSCVILGHNSSILGGRLIT